MNADEVKEKLLERQNKIDDAIIASNDMSQKRRLYLEKTEITVLLGQLNAVRDKESFLNRKKDTFADALLMDSKDFVIEKDKNQSVDLEGKLRYSKEDVMKFFGKEPDLKDGKFSDKGTDKFFSDDSYSINFAINSSVDEDGNFTIDTKTKEMLDDLAYYQQQNTLEHLDDGVRGTITSLAYPRTTADIKSGKFIDSDIDASSKNVFTGIVEAVSNPDMRRNFLFDMGEQGLYSLTPTNALKFGLTPAKAVGYTKLGLTPTGKVINAFAAPAITSVADKVIPGNEGKSWKDVILETLAGGLVNIGINTFIKNKINPLKRELVDESVEVATPKISTRAVDQAKTVQGQIKGMEDFLKATNSEKKYIEYFSHPNAKENLADIIGKSNCEKWFHMSEAERKPFIESLIERKKNVLQEIKSSARDVEIRNKNTAKELKKIANTSERGSLTLEDIANFNKSAKQLLSDDYGMTRLDLFNLHPGVQTTKNFAFDAYPQTINYVSNKIGELSPQAGAAMLPGKAGEFLDTKVDKEIAEVEKAKLLREQRAKEYIEWLESQK